MVIGQVVDFIGRQLETALAAETCALEHELAFASPCMGQEIGGIVGRRRASRSSPPVVPPAWRDLEHAFHRGQWQVLVAWLALSGKSDFFTSSRGIAA